MEINVKFKYEYIHKCLLRVQTCFGICRTSFWEGGELRLIYLKFDMLKKEKQAKTREKTPNQTTTKPTPLHEITTTTMFLLKTLNKIRHYILFWCSLHGFIAVYIFFCTVQA